MATSESTDIIRVPGKRPEKICREPHPLSVSPWCNRRHGHTGRHAFIWWHIDGRVRAVWGDA